MYLDKNFVKENKFAALAKKLPPKTFRISSLILNLVEDDDEYDASTAKKRLLEKKSIAKDITNSFNFLIAVMDKLKYTVNIERLEQQPYYGLNTYYNVLHNPDDKKSPLMDFSKLFMTAFDLSAMKYWLENYNNKQFDGATIVLLGERNDFANAVLKCDKVVDYKSIIDKIMESWSSNINYTNDYMRFLISKDMDSRIYTIQHELFNAMRDKNSDKFKEILLRKYWTP